MNINCYSSILTIYSNKICVLISERYDEILGFWSDVYGFCMPSLRTETLNKAQVEIVPADRIITGEYKLCTFDMYTCDTNSTNFKTEFNLNIIKTCKMTGIVGYFDSIFDNNKPVTLSTAPHSPPTHWKQTVFLLPDPIDVIEGNFHSKLLRECHINVF